MMALELESKPQIRQYGLYIGGQWQEAASGKSFKSINPHNQEVVAEVALGDREDAQRAIEAARKAFDSGVWSDMPAEKRSRILLDIVERIRSREQDLMELETRDGGFPIRKTTMMDVPVAIEHFRHFARLADFDWHEPLPWIDFPAVSWNFVAREPYGVCVGITPWNFPLLMAVWKIAPALAAGNTLVLKPASDTPCTALELARIIDESELPKGVLNVVTGSGGTLGEELASNPLVDKVAFTGSTEVGRRIMELASRTVKKVTLELGGKSPVLILPDANLDLAVDGALFGVFFNHGQACEAGTRLFLPESLYDVFMERLLERARLITLGDPLDFSTTMGPVSSARQRETVEGYIRKGQEEGAKLVFGGGRPQGPAFERGFYVEPTVFTDVRNDMTIAREEIFGPVLAVIRYKTEAEAINMANDTPYGLAAAVWSEDVHKAIEVARRIRAGTVWINDHHLLNCKAPFGGYKQSGVGREFGTYGLSEYLQIKHVHVDQTRGRAKRFWLDLVIND